MDSRARALLLAVAGGLAGCLAEPEAPEAVAPDAAPPVRFVVFGDSGTGTEEQYQVARAMGDVCWARGCDFLVHTGDILYDVGAFSVDDPQFDHKFERPYGGLGLPVHLVLGNHDVGGDPSSPEDLDRWQTVGDRMVAYAHRDDRPTASWRMPARWYAFQHGPVAFAAFDSTAFVYAPMEPDPQGPIHRAAAEQDRFAQEAFPADATWRFAVAHHPYVSNGLHGDAGRYDAREPELRGALLESFYESRVCGRADALLAGHDHDLQWLSPVPGCGATRFLVSGAAAKPRPLADPDRHPAVFQRGGVLGFWWLEADGDRLRLAAYDGDAQLLHEAVWERTTEPRVPGGSSGPSGPSTSSASGA